MEHANVGSSNSFDGLSRSIDSITTRVWIRSETVELALGIVLDSSIGSVGRYKPWSWTLARLVSGSIENDFENEDTSEDQPGVVVTIDDESSFYNGRTLDIPRSLLFSSPKPHVGGSKKTTKSGTGRPKPQAAKSATTPFISCHSFNGSPDRHTASFTGPGYTSATFRSRSEVSGSKTGTSDGKGKVCNIYMANPSDGYFGTHDASKGKEQFSKNESSTEIHKTIDKDSSEIVSSHGECHLKKNSDSAPPHDLQSLPYLHEPSVVHTLYRRYENDAIYTSTGNQILVALNPFKAITFSNETNNYEAGSLIGEDLYGDKVLDGYASLGEWEDLNGKIEFVRNIGGTYVGNDLPEPLPPHVFRISDTAFRAMMSGIRSNEIGNKGKNKSNATEMNANQSLLVSGESGAGKTVTTKHVLRYLASLSQRRGGKNMTKAQNDINSFASGKFGRPSLRNLVKAPSSYGTLYANAPMKRGSLRRASVSRRSNFFGDSTGGGAISMDGITRPTVNRQPSWILGSHIEVQILEANPILESFGNARTVRNDNSSRFGKYIELHFKSTGSLIGASIETYLLEKVRLLRTEKGERNYHIFYEIMEGASEEEVKEYLLEGYEAVDFKLMNQSGIMHRRDGVEDQDEFDSLIESMTLLQFDPMHIKNIMRVTVACMHALNLTFTAPSAYESDLDDTNPHLKPVLTLLGIEYNNLRDALCSYEILIGGRDKQKRNQNKEHAEKGMEAFIKSIYSAMFDHLVDHINQRIGYKAKKGTAINNVHAASIGILDIFGFESFERNSFEQLCINYCNEALQQQFNGVVFKSQKEEYDREGIDSSFIKFPDNQDAIDIIDKGVLATLDDMSFAPATNDDKFANMLYQKMDQNPTHRFEVSFLQKGKKQFVINHYAGPVEYSIETFIEKNKDEIPRGMSELLRSSSNPFLSLLENFLVTKDAAVNGGGNEGSSRKTVGAKKKQNTVARHFTSQLKQLRTKISQTTPYFVRCIKPNQELTANNFDHDIVIDQLKSLGVLEAVRVSRMGFPKSFSHIQFVRRYRALMLRESRTVSTRDSKDLCKIIVDESLSQLSGFLAYDDGEKGFQIGSTKVFLGRRHSDGLEWLLNKVMKNASIIIQSAVRCKMAWMKLVRLKRQASAIKIQCRIRCYLEMRNYKKLISEKSAVVIQTRYRGAVQRNLFKLLLEEKKKMDIIAMEMEKRYQKRKAERESTATDGRLETSTLTVTNEEKESPSSATNIREHTSLNQSFVAVPERSPPADYDKLKLWIEQSKERTRDFFQKLFQEIGDSEWFNQLSIEINSETGTSTARFLKRKVAKIKSLTHRVHGIWGIPGVLVLVYLVSVTVYLAVGKNNNGSIESAKLRVALAKKWNYSAERALTLAEAEYLKSQKELAEALKDLERMKRYDEL